MENLPGPDGLIYGPGRNGRARNGSPMETIAVKIAIRNLIEVAAY